MAGCNVNQSYSTGSVLESAWEQFDLDSYQIDETSSTIWIVVNYDTDVTKLRKFLVENLSEMDKEIYKLDIQKVLRLDNQKRISQKN